MLNELKTVIEAKQMAENITDIKQSHFIMGLHEPNSIAKQILAFLSVAALFGGPLAVDCRAQLAGTGVNLAGAEFGVQAWGVDNVPGVYGYDYTYPTSAEIDYYVGKGVNVFRLPFAWERLQPTLNGTLDATELGRIDSFVTYATGQGASVLLDPHNYARYSSQPYTYSNNVIGTDVPEAAFANLWSQLATKYKDNSRVVFGLMNEPHDLSSTATWVSAANAALSAIRTTGATNLVTVPGNYYTGAWSWTTTDNAVQMLNIVDPGNNYVYEVHQYLDTDSSGTSTTVVSETIGVERLTDFTEWLIANDRKAFLGEFAVANSMIGSDPSQIGDEAINNMLGYMAANSEVWTGFTWWAGGPWWGDYMYTIEPTNLGTSSQADQPSMTLLEPYFAAELEYSARTEQWLNSSAVVPEPSTSALLVVAIIGAGWAIRRRQSRNHIPPRLGS